ncbi:MAG: hypothetical protein ICV66_12905 [Chitinophagaceae bacterium]|nr:hypothetical protein [Chitinophagaceae bacterium]
MVRIESLINEKEIQFLSSGNTSLMNIAQNRYTLIDHLLISSVFCPELLVIDDVVFISEFYGKTNFTTLSGECNNDPTLMEKMINTKLLSDFFILGGNFDEMANENESLLLKFGYILKFFWQNWFNKNFPERNFAIEVGKNLFPEEDLAITVYQERLVKITHE